MKKIFIWSAICGLLLLGIWFSVALIFPKYCLPFGGLEAANGLITAIATVGLVVTIAVQIHLVNDQNRKESFNHYIKRLEDLHSDLKELEFEGKKGIHLLSMLRAEIKGKDNIEVYSPFFLLVSQIGFQLNAVLNDWRCDKNVSKEQKGFLTTKIMFIYFSLLCELFTVVRNNRKRNETYYSNLYLCAEIVQNSIQTQMGLGLNET